MKYFSFTTLFIAFFLLFPDVIFAADSDALSSVETLITIQDKFLEVINNLSKTMVKTSLGILGFLVLLDLALFMVFNFEDITGKGVTIIIPDLFKRIVIWGILTFAITTYSGVKGADAIKQAANNLLSGGTGLVTLSVQVQGPTDILKEGTKRINKLDQKLKEVQDEQSENLSWWGEVKQTPQLIVAAILYIIGIAIAYLTYASLAVKALLFQVASPIVMLFAGVGFAMSAVKQLQSQGMNIIMSMLRMIFHLASIYIVVLIINSMFDGYIENISAASNSGWTIDNMISLMFGLIIVSFIALYLSVVLPNLVQQLISGTGSSAGERAGDSLAMKGLAAGMAGLGAAMGAATEALKGIAGGDEGGEGDEGGGHDGQQDTPSTRSSSSGSSGGSSSKQTGSLSDPYRPAGYHSPSSSSSGGGSSASSGGSDSDRDSDVNEYGMKPGESLSDRYRPAGSSSGGGSGGSSGSDSSSSGGSGEGSGGSGSDSAETKVVDNKKDVDEVSNDQINIKKRPGNNSVSGAGGDDGESESAIAKAQSSGKTSSETIVTSSNKTVTKSNQETKTEIDSGDK